MFARPLSSVLHLTRILLFVALLTWITGCGGGGGSTPPAVPTPTPNNPAPAVTSVSPSSASAGSQGFTLTVNGKNFISSSVMEFNGTARTTTFVSTTELQTPITAADIATTAVNKVAVSNPPPGGGLSASVDFAVSNPLPTVASLNPSFIPQGSPDFTVTVIGTGFVSTSSVLLNGSARPTTFISNTTLQAGLTAADAAATGIANIAVRNPAPGGGASNAQTFTVTVGAPSITLLTPGSAVAGGSDFTLTVTGTGFRPGATVEFSGTGLTTTFISSTEIQAQVTAAQIASTGAASVTVVNPITTTAALGSAPVIGPTSKPWDFLVGTTGGTGFAMVILNQQASDLAYDPAQNQIYTSIPHTAATDPDSIGVVDLASAKITTSVPAGTNPNVLAISGDSQFLYAGIDGAGSVQRFALPLLTKDISLSLGTGFSGTLTAHDLQVAPGSPHTIAVVTGDGGGITVFDDATPRPNAISAFFGFSAMQWGADSTTLYADDFSADFETFTVNADGVSTNKTFQFLFNGGRPFHFLPQTSLIYTEDGRVLHPDSGVPVANLNANGAAAVDAALNAAFFVGPTTTGIGLQCFDLKTFTLSRSVPLPAVFSTPQYMIRWGQNGLAFNTDGGQIVILGGNILDPVSTTFTPPPPPSPVPPPLAPNAPAITSLTPASAIAAGPAFTLAVNGSNFDPAAQVQFNGSSRTTTFVSSTQLQAAITAGDIAQIGVASITVANPVASGGVGAPASFMIGSSGGLGFASAIINTPANDLIYDREHQAIYLSVSNSVATGNSISVLDLPSLTISGEQFAGSNPDVLAISDDDQFLYTGVDGTAAVQRFTLPSLTPDINYPLGSGSFGPFFALDLQVAPGAPHTTAVSLGKAGSSPRALGGVTIFDDATARPTSAPGSFNIFDSLQWGADASTLLAANSDDTGFDFYTLAVNPTGVTLKQDFPSTFRTFGNRIHYDRGSNLVYADDGHVVDPATGLYAGIFQTAGLMVPDSSLNTAFFLTQPTGFSSVTIQAFDLTHFLPAGSITIPNINGTALHLIRWGRTGSRSTPIPEKWFSPLAALSRHYLPHFRRLCLCLRHQRPQRLQPRAQ